MRREQKNAAIPMNYSALIFGDLTHLALSNPNRLKNNRNKLFESDWLPELDSNQRPLD